uniref:Uncharacterized protein n=1 Tax=Strongyloides venezuelensis TaxID=75913 RepID=A0A0K0FQ36_STRVS
MTTGKSKAKQDNDKSPPEDGEIIENPRIYSETTDITNEEDKKTDTKNDKTTDTDIKSDTSKNKEEEKNDDTG